jgi:hypothetical protein
MARQHPLLLPCWLFQDPLLLTELSLPLILGGYSSNLLLRPLQLLLNRQIRGRLSSISRHLLLSRPIHGPLSNTNLRPLPRQEDQLLLLTLHLHHHSRPLPVLASRLHKPMALHLLTSMDMQNMQPQTLLLLVTISLLKIITSLLQPPNRLPTQHCLQCLV